MRRVLSRPVWSFLDGSLGLPSRRLWVHPSSEGSRLLVRDLSAPWRFLAMNGAVRVAAAAAATGCVLFGAACGSSTPTGTRPVVSQAAQSPASKSPIVDRSSATGSGAGGNRLVASALPFVARYPRPYAELPTAGMLGVSVALLIDRRNVILFYPHGLVGDERSLENNLAVALRARGYAGALYREHYHGRAFLWFDLGRPRYVAGQPVFARRYYFMAGGRVWEMSCQATKGLITRSREACGQIVRTLTSA